MKNFSRISFLPLLSWGVQVLLAQPVAAQVVSPRTVLRPAASAPAAPGPAPARPAPPVSGTPVAPPPAAATAGPPAAPSPVGPPQVLAVRLKGIVSADSENVNGEHDPHQSLLLAHNLRLMLPSASHTIHLKDSPDAATYFEALKRDLSQFNMHVALLGGHKYMINSCLGVKASAGEFDLTVPSPDIRVENTGIVMTYAISHIGLNVLRVRLRPDLGDVVQPCHFSGRISLGGYANNVRYELHLDPILDLEQCKIGSLGQVKEIWRVDQFRLEPLPPEVGTLAKDMVEDALTYASNFNVVDRVVASITGALGVQCHK